MIELNDENFEAETNGKHIVVIDFWAEWCGPCKTIAPIVEQFAAGVPEGVMVAKVDVDECNALSNKFNIRNIPTILFIKDGEIVDKHVGVCTLETLNKKLLAL